MAYTQNWTWGTDTVRPIRQTNNMRTVDNQANSHQITYKMIILTDGVHHGSSLDGASFAGAAAI